MGVARGLGEFGAARGYAGGPGAPTPSPAARARERTESAAHDKQSTSRSPRNAGDLDDFVSLEGQLAAATDRIAAFERSLDAARANAAAQTARADRAERNLAASTVRVDELEREVRRLGGEVAEVEGALSRRRAPDVEAVTDLALRHGVVSLRILALRSSRNGGRAYCNNDRTPVDEATLLATRAALQEVIACRMSGTTASQSSEAIVERETAARAYPIAIARAEAEIEAKNGREGEDRGR